MFASIESKIIAGAVGLFVVMGLVIAIIYYRGEAATEKANADSYKVQLQTAVQVNAENQKTIDRITQMRAQNDAILVDLNNKLDTVNNTAQQTQDNIARIAHNDKKVQDFLDTPLPAALASLLNCGPNGCQGSHN